MPEPESYIVWDLTGRCMGVHLDSAEHYRKKGYTMVLESVALGMAEGSAVEDKQMGEEIEAVKRGFVGTVESLEVDPTGCGVSRITLASHDSNAISRCELGDKMIIKPTVVRWHPTQTIESIGDGDREMQFQIDPDAPVDMGIEDK